MSRRRVRRRRDRKQSKPPAASRPGTLAIPEGSPPPRLYALRWSAEELREEELGDLARLPEFLRPGGSLWLDVQGLGSSELLQQLGERLHIHPLALEDVVHVPQRPKSESYEGFAFHIARTLAASTTPGVDGPESRQLSLLIGDGWVVSLQEDHSPRLEAVKKRLRVAGSRMRLAGPDYLAYAVLDAVIDEYFPYMESLGDRLEALEQRVIDAPTNELLCELQNLRSELQSVRRILWPQREAVATLMRPDMPHVSESVRFFLRDCHDHCVQVAEVVDSSRELASGLMNLYLTALANRTNEVMKVLTIMASIFIPLTFMAGLYGMNFKYMPELDWPWAYPVLLALMGLVTLGLVLYFRRKGWIGRPPA